MAKNAFEPTFNPPRPPSSTSGSFGELVEGFSEPVTYHHHHHGNIFGDLDEDGARAEIHQPPIWTSEPELEPLPDDFRELSTEEAVFVGKEIFRYTLIWMGDGEERRYVKIVKDEFSLYSLKFGAREKSGKIIDVPAPGKLNGSFTDINRVNSVLDAYCEDKKIPLEISHISADGSKRIRVNPRALR
ncbi:hypothetical protein [Chelativorans sp. AA-79]|uniref:hypothetical protein n=1 Tax=Chelativorans sp. AA-79 TaxID=3028735 RepID=UPI0023F989D2|nr:hypothetical protein [Chelativorans sp. AA-79]WEX07288.1 hypothetical protein PVE73_14220 [Chelativorans sp. AA-79]